MNEPTPALSPHTPLAARVWAHVHDGLVAVRHGSVVALILGLLYIAWSAKTAIVQSLEQRSQEQSAAAAPKELPSQPTTPTKRGGFLGMRNVGGTGQAWLQVPRPLPPTQAADGTLTPAPANCPSTIDVWRAPDPKSRAAMEKKYAGSDGEKRVDLDKMDLLAEQDLEPLRYGGAIAATVDKGGRLTKFKLVSNPRPTWSFKPTFEISGGVAWIPHGDTSLSSQFGPSIAAALEPVRFHDWHLQLQGTFDYLPAEAQSWRPAGRLLLVRRWGGE